MSGRSLVIALSGRYVRTPEGVRKYKQPINTLIRPDVVPEAIKSHARHLLDDMPDAPKKVPKGYVRLWHYTKGDPEEIADKGLLVNKNTYGGVGGEPTGVWLSTKRPESSSKPIIEVVMPISELSGAADNPKYLDPDEYGNNADYGHYVAEGDVPSKYIVNLHRKWQWWVEKAQAHPKTLERVLAGDFDAQ
jgi:hypothetical protein